ncbi:MAG: histidine kinase [Proteobacteria bacterium]|nr:histidine kinase [Pseudomonadota bacterium]
MFNLMRHYAITSFISVLVAAVLLTAFYRHVEVQETTDFARKTNIALTEAVLDSVRLDLGEYLGAASNLGPREIARAPFPSTLAATIVRLMEKTSIGEVRIYNNLGVIVFSTRDQVVGTIDPGSSGFASASKGQSASDLVYRDAFSSFGRATEGDNLVHTFVPVRLGPAGAISGVLATDVDLSPAVAQTEREVFTVIGGILLILMLLYSAQLLVVMRAKKVIEAQQDTIRERTETLEAMSLQLLTGEEAQKLNLAVSLHEGLAQTLTAVKVGIEQGLERTLPETSRDKSLNTAISALQGAIEEVQEMAAELRPSSLD